MRMRTFLLLWMSVAILVSAVGSSHAQPSGQPAIELDFDFQARLAAVGNSSSSLHSSTVQLTDAFNSSWKVNLYGADRRGVFLAQQASVEKQWGNQRLQGGIIRLPFGIYDLQETYATGLIDYPMARSDYRLNSVTWGVPGIAWSGGSPNLQVEAAGFNGRSAGVWSNPNIVGGEALRVQTYSKGLILGASHWDGYMQFGPDTSPHRGVSVSGLDVRYTRPHLLLRGEYLAGRLSGLQMHGWYLDAYYHLPKYAKFTLVGRLEELKPGSDLPRGQQVTLGVRYTAAPDWIFSVNWRKNNGESMYEYSWTPPAGKGGDFLFQVYHKLPL